MRNLILPLVVILMTLGSSFAQDRVSVEIRPTVVLNGNKAQYHKQRPPMRHNQQHHYGHHKNHQCGHMTHPKPQPPHRSPSPQGPMRGPRR